MRPVEVNLLRENTPSGRKSKRDMNATSWSKIIKETTSTRRKSKREMNATSWSKLLECNFSDWSEIEERLKCDQSDLTHQENPFWLSRKSQRDINETSWSKFIERNSSDWLKIEEMYECDQLEFTNKEKLLRLLDNRKEIWMRPVGVYLSRETTSSGQISKRGIVATS